MARKTLQSHRLLRENKLIEQMTAVIYSNKVRKWCYSDPTFPKIFHWNLDIMHENFVTVCPDTGTLVCTFFALIVRVRFYVRLVCGDDGVNDLRCVIFGSDNVRRQHSTVDGWLHSAQHSMFLFSVCCILSLSISQSGKRRRSFTTPPLIAIHFVYGITNLYHANANRSLILSVKILLLLLLLSKSICFVLAPPNRGIYSWFKSVFDLTVEN